MDSPSTPMSSDSFLNTGDVTVGLSIGEKLIILLHSAGMKDEVISDPEVIDEMVADNQEEWSTIFDSLVVVTQPEIEAHEEFNNQVTEAEIDKVLKETLGIPEKKVCVTEEIVDIASAQWEATKTKFETVHKAISYIKGKITECDKNLNSTERANQNLSSNINQISTSIDTQLDILSEHCSELSQVVNQCLSGQAEKDCEILKSDTPFLLSLNKLLHGLSEIVESTLHQLLEQLKVGDELAGFFTSPRLGEIQIEESIKEVLELLELCQGLFDLIVFLQTLVMVELNKKEHCQNVASKLLEIVPSRIFNVVDQLKNLREYNEELKTVEVITPTKLVAMNEALTGQSSLVTPENFISSLTTLDKKVDEEVIKCAQEILIVNENQLIEITGVQKLIEEMDLQADEIDQKAKKFIEYKTAILNLQEHIKNLKDTFSKQDSSDKEKLINLMILCFIDHDRFVKTVDEMKRTFQILSKAMS